MTTVTFQLHEPRGHIAVTVCDKCLRASCWQGLFMCDEAQNAGTREMAPADLLALKLEHPSYWKAEIDAAIDAAMQEGR